MRTIVIILLFLSAWIHANTADMSIKAVVFDCDGILVDSEALKLRAWQEVLQKEGISFDKEEYLPLIGHTGKFILAAINEKRHISLPPSLIDQKNEIYRFLQTEGIDPIPATSAVLNWLREEKETLRLPLGVASTAGKKEILFNLHHLKIADLFDIVLSGKEDLTSYHDPEGTNKPKPYIYMEACARLGIRPEECLVFEDTQAGVESAKTAGCRVIALPTQWTGNQDFSRADYIFYQDSEEILRLVQELTVSKNP